MSDTKGHPEGRAHEGEVRHENPLVANEPTDVNVRGITKWGIGLGLFTIASVFVVLFIFQQLAGYEARQSAPASPLVDLRERRLPPEPRLQAAPRSDVDQLRAREEETLTKPAWTDRERGLARIPVDRAMNLMLQKGFPVRAPQSGAAAQIPSDSSSGRTTERRAQ